MYYALLPRWWHPVMILVRTNHHWLRVGRHKRHLIKLVIFFLILHIVNSDNSFFAKNNTVFLLIFLDQVCKTLVQQLKREPKVHLYDPHFSSQQLWTHIHRPQCHVGASPIDIWVQEFIKTFHSWLLKFLQCTHNKHFCPMLSSVSTLTPLFWHWLLQSFALV
jgi:hypothetical protein